MMILGIDPGLSGAIAIYENGKVQETFVMPVIKVTKTKREIDLVSLVSILKTVSTDSHAFLEKVHAMPGQGVSTMFKMGRTYGMIEAILATLAIPYTLVAPRAWTKEMHQGVIGDKPKAKSLMACKRLFPSVNLLATDRSRVAHDGIVDAVLIASYGSKRV